MNSTSPLTFGRTLGIGSLVIVLFEIIAIFAGATLGSFGAFFILLFGGFGLIGLAYQYIKDWAGVAGLIGFLAGAVISYSAKPLSLMFSGQKISLDHPISVALAPQYDVTLYEFTDGVVQTKYLGYYSYSGRTMKSPTGGRGHEFTAEYIVAPLVGANWTPTDAIPVWAVCKDSWDPTEDVSDTDVCRREWSKDIRTGVTLDASQTTHIKTAIADAMAEHNLKSDPNAKFIVWSKDATLEANGAKGLGTAIIVLAHLSYLVVVVAKRKQL